MSNDAEAEHIALVVVGFLVLSAVLDDLWSHVAHGSAPFVAFSGDAVVQDEAESEVDDVRLEGLHVDEDVLGFQVAVDDVVGVDVLDAFQQHSQDGHDDGWVGDLLLLPQDHQVLAGQVLHDDDVVVFVFV